ncbi:MAG TPA: hypothetical protein VK028_15275 [Micromonosporaceae bacterium]|nr:hypothetical protein [Micromonosporaceae bacterium]
MRLREAVPGLIKQLPQHKPWMVAIGVIATVVVIATCSFASYLLVADDGKLVGATPTPTIEVPLRDISSRKADPEPLTADDLFPTSEIIADPNYPPYVRIGEPQVAKDCRTAASGEVGKLLKSLGCNQVVRATFRSPDGGYYITAGVFNLRDEAAATKAHNEVQSLVDELNRFNGYIPDRSLRVLGTSPTYLSWDMRGHFLIYCVIARVDGGEHEPDDPNLTLIVYDLVETYLRDKKLGEWAIDRSTPGPDASASAAAGEDGDAT